MPGNQAPGGYAQQGGYAQASNQPAVPARAGGIPVLPTGVARGARPEEPTKVAAPVTSVRNEVVAPIRNTVVAIPSPTELGLGSAPSASATVALDWAATHRQLDEIGAVRFEMEKLTSGGAKFTCWLRDGSSLRPITGEGASQSEAVSLCLARARQVRPRLRFARPGRRMDR